MQGGQCNARTGGEALVGAVHERHDRLGLHRLGNSGPLLERRVCRMILRALLIKLFVVDIIMQLIHDLYTHGDG